MTPPKIHLPHELALLLALATLWGASYTLIRVAVETIPPLTLMAARTAIAGTLLLAVLRARGLRMPVGKAIWVRLVLQACLNSAIPFTLIAWAEQSIDAGMASILNSTTPIFTFLITVLVTRHERVKAGGLLGVIAGLAGTCLIIGLPALSGLGDDLWAQLAMLAAAVCYAGAAICGRHFRGLDPLVPAAGSLLCAALLLTPLSLAIDRPWMLTPSPASLLALAGLSVLSTALAFALYFRLIRTLGSLGTTAQGYLRVPIAIAIGIAFLGESLTATALAGLACILAGVAAMTLTGRRVAKAGV